jgi:hypothetical protein
MPLMSDAEEGRGRVRVWQCSGCGRIEAPQPCIGVCEDRKIELVHAADYEDAVAEVRAVREQVKALEKIVRHIAWSTPRSGEWERSYRSLQEQARHALAGPGGEAPAAPAEPQAGEARAG